MSTHAEDTSSFHGSEFCGIPIFETSEEVREQSDERGEESEAGSAHRILFIEDDPGLVRTLTDRLETEGYLVESESDGESGYERARRGTFDLILLDIVLPGMNGLNVCRLLRQHGVQTPIIFLSARSHEVDKVIGLKIGADDYLTKPFQIMELLARVEAVLRRANGGNGAPDTYVCGPVRVDIRNAVVTLNNKPADLSALEFNLLRFFIEHRGVVVSRTELLREVWGREASPGSRAVDVHVASLRRKLESNPAHPQHLLTVHRVGYKWNDKV